jgi:hypothetical protein
MDVACAQRFVSRVAIHARKVFFTNGADAMTGLLLHLLTVDRLQWAKYSNVARLQFVRCTRWQSAENNVLLRAVCHHF